MSYVALQFFLFPLSTAVFLSTSLHKTQDLTIDTVAATKRDKKKSLKLLLDP